MTQESSEFTLCVIAYVDRRCVCFCRVRHACRARCSVPASRCEFTSAFCSADHLPAVATCSPFYEPCCWVIAASTRRGQIKLPLIACMMRRVSLRSSQPVLFCQRTQQTILISQRFFKMFFMVVLNKNLLFLEILVTRTFSLHSCLLSLHIS